MTDKIPVKREKVDKKTIGTIKFGIYSTEEIINMSVCEITNPDKDGYGSVYDPRMGTTKPCIGCETCGLRAQECQGHFGHIKFPLPIIHPLLTKKVEQILNCVCFSCYRLLLTKDMVISKGINKFKSKTRFMMMIDTMSKVEICCHCNEDHPTVKVSPTDQTFSKIYDEKDKGKIIIPMEVHEIKLILDSIPNEDISLLGIDPICMHQET